jgi:hypothetical protein
LRVPAGAPAAVVGFGAVLALGGRDGGFDAQTWGWVALPLLLVLLACSSAPTFRLTRLERGLLAALALLAVWTALSALWAPTAGPPVEEAERAVLYAAAVAAVLATGARARPTWLTGGVLAASLVLCAWSLERRLLPAQAVTGRLLGPLGYTNGLGLLAAMGILLALGFAARHAAAAAALVVLVPTLVFTFSRGSWLALAAGLVVLAVLEARAGRLVQIAAAVPVAAAAGWLADRAPALTHTGHPLAEAQHDGRRLLLELAALALVAPLPVVAARRAPAFRPGTRTLAGAAVALALAGVAAGLVVHAHRSSASSSLDARLVSLSSSGRGDYWRAALDEVRAHPLLGGGAGTWNRWWLLHRPPGSMDALDAHELYLETLAELGPLGLALLAAALAVPLVALRRALRAPLAPACAAAYVALLVHAAVDWDWELSGVMLAGLLCGAVLVAAAGGPVQRLSPSVRGATAATVAAAAAAVFVLQIGNSAAAAAADALDAGRFDEAAREARRAASWQPWSTQPQLDLAEARLAVGDLTGAADELRRVVRRDPGDWQGWYELALATSGREHRLALVRARSLNPYGPAADIR